jgi:Domain of unknown function (DUF4260)
MQTVLKQPTPSAIRAASGALSVVLLAVLVSEVAGRGTGYWQLAAFALAPDLALFFGAGTGLERGQLHPRAVPLYNLLHRAWLPLAVVALGAVGVVPAGYLVGGLAWCLHVSVDRALGYGLRTRDGFQRR